MGENRVTSETSAFRRAAVSAALLLIPFCCTVEAAADAPHPNILFIFIDDLGYGDLSCTGNRDVETPHIDRLAAQGVRFTQFYVASPICSPSRVGITTGQYPARHLIHSYIAGSRQNRARGMRNWLDPKAPCIARAFQQAGYATGHFGKWHMGGGRDVGDAPLPKVYGFDESLVSFEGLGDRILPPGGLGDQSAKLGRGKIRRVPKYRQTQIYVDRTIDFIKRRGKKPFYVHLWLNDVHDPHQPDPKSLANFARFAKTPALQKFYAVLVKMDRQIGRLLRFLDDERLAESTLVVLTSDNGPTAWPRYYRQRIEPPGSTGGLRGRKWSLYEGGIRMPLIVRWKGKIPAGRVNKTSVIAAVDFFPTFCKIAGVTPPKAAFDGEDMSAAFLGGTPKRTKPIFWEYGRDATYLRPGKKSDQSPSCAVREGNWKLLANADGSRVELYDLATDPHESRNLAMKRPAVSKRLTAKLLGWRKSLPVLRTRKSNN
jgi:arylsulfatase A-like enzyme